MNYYAFIIIFIQFIFGPNSLSVTVALSDVYGLAGLDI